MVAWDSEEVVHPDYTIPAFELSVKLAKCMAKGSGMEVTFEADLPQAISFLPGLLELGFQDLKIASRMPRSAQRSPAFSKIRVSTSGRRLNRSKKAPKSMNRWALPTYAVLKLRNEVQLSRSLRPSLYLPEQFG